MHDVLNILRPVAFCPEQIREFLKIGNGIQVIWTLFRTITTIQVASNACMKRVACQLTDMGGKCIDHITNRELISVFTLKYQVFFTVIDHSIRFQFQEVQPWMSHFRSKRFVSQVKTELLLRFADHPSGHDCSWKKVQIRNGKAVPRIP